jgi:cytidylate kinase
VALTIAIDGPAGAGKSSAAKGVARTLDVDYIDTGAMYRALTWWMLEHDIDIDDHDQIAAHAHDPEIRIAWDPDQPRIVVDEQDVTAAIRESRVSDCVSRVSAVPAIRSRLVDLQRAMVAQSVRSGRGVVMEGRDIGTVVLPDASVKVFLTADVEVRAARRAAEDRVRDPNAHADHIDAALANLKDRDAIDSTRVTSPLTMAPDAVQIDATDLTLDEVIAAIASLAAQRR